MRGAAFSLLAECGPAHVQTESDGSRSLRLPPTDVLLGGPSVSCAHRVLPFLWVRGVCRGSPFLGSSGVGDTVGTHLWLLLGLFAYSKFLTLEFTG